MLVQYNGKNIFRASGVRFLPGANKLEDKVWEECKKHPLVKWRVAQQILVEVKPDASDAAKTSERDTLKGFTETAAVELVGKTIDKELLEEWQGGETRAKVVSALNKRLEEITPKKGETKDGSSEDEQK